MRNDRVRTLKINTGKNMAASVIMDPLRPIILLFFSEIKILLPAQFLSIRNLLQNRSVPQFIPRLFSTVFPMPESISMDHPNRSLRCTESRADTPLLKLRSDDETAE